MNLNVETKVDGARAAVVVAGEVDVSNAGTVREAVDELMQNEAIKAIEVDMANVPYIDSTGIGVLVGSAHKAHDTDRTFALVDAQDNVVRILGMLGVDEVITVKASGAN